MERKLIFIGGVGRSGTSITRQLIASHNQVITFSFEYRFIIDPDGIVDFINSSLCSWSPFYIDKRLKRLEILFLRMGKINLLKFTIGRLIRSNHWLKSKINADAYHGWNLQAHFPNYHQHVKRLICNLEEFSYKGAWVGADSFKLNNKIRYSPLRSETELYRICANFFDELYLDLFQKHNKNILVEDNTWNLLFASELSKLFPDAKFIHIHREPRDVVSSFCKQRWMPSDKVQSAIICRDLYTRTINNLNALETNKVLQFSLEEFITKKETILLSISKFIGIPVTNEMLNFRLSDSSIGRWKADFSKQDLVEIEPILREITETLGYEWH